MEEKMWKSALASQMKNPLIDARWVRKWKYKYVNGKRVRVAKKADFVPDVSWMHKGNP